MNVCGFQVSPSHRDGPKFGQRLSHDGREVPFVLSAGPPFEGDAQHGHAGLGRQGGVWLSDAPLTQGGRDGRGVVGQFGELSLAQLDVGCHDGVALSGQVSAELSEHGGGCVEAARHRVEGAVRRRRTGNSTHDPLLEELRTTEEHFSLVREVPEEGSFGQTGPGGDLGRRCLIETPFREESQSGLL